jgi:hypothetical protein
MDARRRGIASLTRVTAAAYRRRHCGPHRPRVGRVEMLLSVWARVRAGWVVIASVLLLHGSALPVSAANTAFDTNLVKNPGAEAGSAAHTGSPGDPTVVAIPKWSSTAGTHFTVVEYGAAGGYPTAAEGNRINGGDQFFAAGLKTSANQCNFLQQNIELVGRDTLINSDSVRADLSAWIATFDSQPDAGAVSVRFLSANANTLGGFSTAVVRKTNGVFQHVTASMVVPRQTHVLKVVLSGVGTPSGAECDAYFDRISVKIHRI